MLFSIVRIFWVRDQVLIELYPLEEPIEREVVRAYPALANAEMLTMPQGSNPAILTPAELEALEGMSGGEVGADQA
jgi:hypothetical protein